MVRKYVLIGLAIIIMLIGAGNFYLMHKYMVEYKLPKLEPISSQQDDFHPALKEDIINRAVALTDPTTGGLVGWYFNSQDQLAVKQLDWRKNEDDSRRVVYVDVASKSLDNRYLAGIMEIHYVHVANNFYAIGLATVNLHMTSPPVKEPVKAQPAAKQAPAHVIGK